MFPGQLDTPDLSVRLVQPDIDRDAALSLQWLDAERGRATLLMMGVPPA